MDKPMRTKHPLCANASNALVDRPHPINISSWWNFSPILGLCLIIQIFFFFGLFLAMHYTADINFAFNRVDHICRDVKNGWLLRALHINETSFFCICIYFYIGWGIYYSSYLFAPKWLVGVIILFLVITTTLVGYILPRGQISLWGATVITNLLSVIQWVEEGFASANATLMRFFTLHFILPFIVTIIYLTFLYESGSIKFKCW